MPNPVTTYVDAEKVAIAYLTPSLPDDPDDFTIDVRDGGGHHVRVRRIGGVDLTPNHDNPLLDVIVWHDSDLERMELAQTLWAALRAASDVVAGLGVLLYQSTTLGPRQMPDPADDTKTVAMFTVQMIVRSL